MTGIRDELLEAFGGDSDEVFDLIMERSAEAAWVDRMQMYNHIMRGDSLATMARNFFVSRALIPNYFRALIKSKREVERFLAQPEDSPTGTAKQMLLEGGLVTETARVTGVPHQQVQRMLDALSRQGHEVDALTTANRRRLQKLLSNVPDEDLTILAESGPPDWRPLAKRVLRYRREQDRLKRWRNKPSLDTQATNN